MHALLKTVSPSATDMIRMDHTRVLATFHRYSVDARPRTKQSLPEHEEMRALIAALRRLDPADEQYDATFMDLMRAVMHHVADEETTLLPEAESVLADRLAALGARMAKRRLELGAPRTGEMARNMARAVPPKAMLFGMGALLAGAFALRRFRRHA